MSVKEYTANGITLKIDHDTCTGCQECVNVCPADVFEMVNDKSTAPNMADCVECCECVPNCPEGAITHESCD